MLRHLVSTLLITVLLAVAVRAEGPRELLVESEARHRSKTLSYAGELTVHSTDGKVRTKGWKSYREGYAGDAKVLVRFLSPPEVRGVGFLSLSKPGKSSDQWLYLPSMKRERRIGAQDRDASFVGTDFSYEDMEEFDHKRYDLKLKGEENLDGQPCWVIEAAPMEEGGRSTFARRLLTLRKDNLYLVRQEYFQTGETSPAKRLTLGDLRETQGRWIAHRLEMNSLKKGSRTVVVLKDVTFDKPHPPERFTLLNLTREGGD